MWHPLATAGSLERERACRIPTDDAVGWNEAIQADIFDHILAVLPEFDLRVFQTLSGSEFQAFTTRSISPYPGFVIHLWDIFRPDGLIDCITSVSPHLSLGLWSPFEH